MTSFSIRRTGKYIIKLYRHVSSKLAKRELKISSTDDRSLRYVLFLLASWWRELQKCRQDTHKIYFLMYSSRTCLNSLNHMHQQIVIDIHSSLWESDGLAKTALPLPTYSKTDLITYKLAWDVQQNHVPGAVRTSQQRVRRRVIIVF